MSFLEWLQEYQEEVLLRIQQHAMLSILVIAMAAPLGVLLSMLVYRSKTLSAALISTASVIFTVPSIAMFMVMISMYGRTLGAVIPVLVLYALLPIVRNCVVGLSGVDESLIDAAQGMGMSRNTILMKVELPLAWPVMLAGLRVSAMLTVGLIALAAFGVETGLGHLILNAMSNLGSVNTNWEALAGTAFTALIAVVFDLVLVLVRRFTTPRGLRV